MNSSKVEIKIMDFELNAEGQDTWVSNQVDNFLDKVDDYLNKYGDLFKQKKASYRDVENADGIRDKSQKLTLQNFIKGNPGRFKTQVDRFLMVAAWLQVHENKEQIMNSDINEALKKAKETNLKNLSDNLNKNIRKGYCNKNSRKEFYVTSQGLTHCGISK